jgi:hypothetical protein
MINVLAKMKHVYQKTYNLMLISNPLKKLQKGYQQKITGNFFIFFNGFNSYDTHIEFWIKINLAYISTFC